MASINLDGLQYNHECVNTTLKYNDVICIQEHWLWKFQTDDVFSRTLPSWKFHARSSDEEQQLPPGQVTRGHGGVAIVWKEYLHPHVKTLPEGNERVLPVIINYGNTPILLICCYLPSGNSRHALENFKEDVAILNELITKYSSNTSIMIAGDLNADLMHRKGKKESMLLSMIEEHNLRNINFNIKDTHTYTNPAISHASHLDYFLVDDKLDWCPTEAIGKDSAEGHLNSSTHIPIQTSAVIDGTTLNRRPSQRGSQKSIKKMKWEQPYIDRYQDTLMEELKKINLDTLSTEAAMVAFTSAIKRASVITMGYNRPHKNQKKRKHVWNPAVKEASARSMAAFWEWKSAGRPSHPHPTAIAKDIAKKMLRSTQRIQEAARREDYLRDIMHASSRDSKTFHRLIKANRNTDRPDLVLRKEEKSSELITDCEAQLEMWQTYFRRLSSSEKKCEQDEETLELMRTHSSSQQDHHIFTPTEVEFAIRKLNCGKAADQDGVTTEHLKFATAETFEMLSAIINRILEEARIPGVCKSGFKIPLPKKGKDSQLQTNYRGITITAVIGKIIEHLVQSEVEPVFKSNTSQLQFGFTAGLSPIMATLCLSEAIATAKKEKSQLYVTALDAQKAFDVVVHPKLKKKIHMSGIQGKTWALIDDLYKDVTECVRWKGQYSGNFPVQKGVRQGAVLSTTLYKLYINELLQILHTSENGMRIGNVYVGSPTCADDQLLLSNSQEEMQAMITSCYNYASDHQYVLHPTKSTITPYLNTPAEANEDWKMGEEKMETTASFTHLGLKWNKGKLSPCIEDRIKTARRTVYSLMGTGLHGVNGLSPAVSAHIIKIYVIPRLLYGLDATVTTKKQKEELSSYHKNLLRSIQGLPRSTACEAIYLLIGELPLESEMDIRTLSLFGAICRAEDSNTLRNLATRQLCMENKYSWFQEIINIAYKYNINIKHTIEAPWRKNAWKDYVTQTVKSFWLKSLLQSAAMKSSLRLMDLSYTLSFKPHPLWIACKRSPRMVPSAVTRARLITGTYMVQVRKSKISKEDVATICPLCHSETEDIPHFLSRCPALQDTRKGRLAELRRKGFYHTKDIRLLLNGPQTKGEDTESINANISDLCHRLHNHRIALLNANQVYPIT